jgi:hypothetical protein
MVACARDTEEAIICSMQHLKSLTILGLFFTRMTSIYGTRSRSIATFSINAVVGASSKMAAGLTFAADTAFFAAIP